MLEMLDPVMDTRAKLVFLDRDGVINRPPAGDGFLTSWENFEFLPGAADAIRLLNHNSILVVVVTNQRGISLGLYSEADLRGLHRCMQEYLANRGAKLDGIYYCPHGMGVCNCRKPKTGMFEQALSLLPLINRSEVIVVGNSDTDMEAAHRLQCRKILVGKERGSIVKRLTERGIVVECEAASLIKAVHEYILN